ncbi:NADP(+)-dependent 2-alkenal reductase-like protein [Tanacetum coccineum]
MHTLSILQPLSGSGVAKVVDSGHANFKKGDFVWGVMRWKEYSIISAPESLFKIQHTDVPLSYYMGILEDKIIAAVIKTGLDYGISIFAHMSLVPTHGP